MVHHAEKPIKLIQIKAVTSCSTYKIDQQETDRQKSKYGNPESRRKFNKSKLFTKILCQLITQGMNGTLVAN